MKGKDQKRERDKQMDGGWTQQAPDYSRPIDTSEQYLNCGNRVSMLYLCVAK